jgi:hypothetical protein
MTRFALLSLGPNLIEPSDFYTSIERVLAAFTA